MLLSYFDSLRNKYSVTALIVGIFLVAVTYIGYRNVTATSHSAAINLTARNLVLSNTNKIRNSLLSAYRAIDLFLLEPANVEYKIQANSDINKAFLLSKNIQNDDWIARNNVARIVLSVNQSLEALNKEVNELFVMRMNPNQQYPSVAIATNEMRPNRDIVNNAIMLAINETKTEIENKNRSVVYDAIVDVRYLWTKMVSNFRIYLANRVGSFYEVNLLQQENNIRAIYEELKINLAVLVKLDEQGDLGFESSYALVDILGSTHNWYMAFEQVVKIHNSNQWRMDATLLKDHVSPLIDDIAMKLSELEDVIGRSAAHDVKVLSDVAHNQSSIAWVITLVGSLFVMLIIVVTQRLVFTPISEVSKALKAVAFGNKLLILPKAQSRETRDLVEAFTEMSKQVRLRQSDLEYQALHDSLTSLPNRTLLLDRLDQEILGARREKYSFALLMLDLNRFKEVNDTLGHQMGDHLLVEVGARLRNQLRDIDTVARLGGDEFAILLPGTDKEHSVVVASKLCEAMQGEFRVNDIKLFTAVSIGIAIYAEHGSDAQTLMQKADVAMYVSKKAQTGFKLYNPNEDEYSISRLAIVNDLRAAIENDGLSLYYQPQIDTQIKQVIGVEALLRWVHPQFGFIPPDQIIPLAEQTGLINNLSYWVLDKAIAQCSEWRKKGIELQVAVNLSVQNLKDEKLAVFIGKTLEANNLPACALTLEITESAMMTNPQYSLDTLASISGLGVRMSVDDFGTGFSSLAYLKQMSLDELKIDKAFILDMVEDDSDEVIVKSTIDMAHNLGLRVIAEGVENEMTWQLLCSFGCDIAQGDYLCEPKNAKEITNWVRKYSETKQLVLL